MRPLRRRRLHRRRHADSRGGRRSARVHLRGQRSAAPERGGAGRGALQEAAAAGQLRRRHRTCSCSAWPASCDPEQKRKIIGGDLHRRLRGGSAQARALRLPGPGHALPRRHRVGLGARPVGHHQEPSQRRRAARADAVQPGRAAPRAVQGRSPRRRARPRHRQGVPGPTAVPGARASRFASSAT